MRSSSLRQSELSVDHLLHEREEKKKEKTGDKRGCYLSLYISKDPASFQAHVPFLGGKNNKIFSFFCSALNKSWWATKAKPRTKLFFTWHQRPQHSDATAFRRPTRRLKWNHSREIVGVTLTTLERSSRSEALIGVSLITVYSKKSLLPFSLLLPLAVALQRWAYTVLDPPAQLFRTCGVS